MTRTDATATTTRLSKGERRDQLLDVAADLLVGRGPTAFTMERLAEWAGVSKALPYAHFENALAVILALRERETGRVAAAMWRAAEEAEQESISADVVGAFFAAVEDRADLLGMLVGPGPVVVAPENADDRMGPVFVAPLLVRFFPVTREQAKAAGSVVLGALMGAVDGWAAGEGSREAMEAIALTSLAGAVGAAVEVA